MKSIATSLAVIVIAGAAGLALSTGHAMLTPEPTWTMPSHSAAADAGVIDGTGASDPGRLSPADMRVSSVMRAAEIAEPGRSAPAKAAGQTADAIATSPRPRPRSDAISMRLASGADMADTAVAGMSSGDMMSGATFDDFDPRDVDARHPKSVSMASLMSKAPMMAPVPGYLHGVFR